MTVVSNDPALLPFVSSLSISSYFTVVSSTMVLYDCVLTFRQEFELVWVSKVLHQKQTG
ncbi:hypothetical protein BDR06DRAFT_951350 [Suillus hirtellus]|nr:hypothetical protein BDR06DRAFT_951350 [Suillus hirtellus]